MANNFYYTDPGAGDVFGAIDLAGVKYQQIMMVDSAGVETDFATEATLQDVVTGIAGISGGTQYTEGDTDASITGPAMLWEDAGDTLVAVSATKPFPVRLISSAITLSVTIASGSVSATQSGTWNLNNISGTISLPTGAATSALQTPFYTEGDTDASISGTAILWEDGSDTLRAVSVAKPLPINLSAVNGTTLSSAALPVSQNGTWNIGTITTCALPSGAATSALQTPFYTEADTDASISGTAILWEDTGDTLRAVSTSKPLPVAQQGSLTIGTMPITSPTAANQVTGNNSLATIAAGFYTEADTDASISGVAILWEDGSDTLRAVSTSKPLPMQISGIAAGLTNTVPVSGSLTNISGTISLPTGAATLAEQQTQTTSLQLLDDTVYTEGATDASITGIPILWEDTSDTLRAASIAKPLPVQGVVGATGGATPGTNNDVDESGDVIKNAAGTLYSLYVFNTTTSVIYVHLYNKATAATAGTDTPVMTFPVPPQGGFAVNVGVGIAFGTGIGIACATTFNGAAGPATNTVFAAYSYA